MPDSWDLPDGQTQVLTFCEVCPAMVAWPRKNLTLGNCPKCGKHHREAWRMAAALRLVDELSEQ